MAVRLTMKARSADVMVVILATVVAAVALGAMWSFLDGVLRYHDTVQHAGVSGWLVVLGGPVACSALGIAFVATRHFRPATIALIVGAGIDVVLACVLTRGYEYPCLVYYACSDQSLDWEHIVSLAQMLLLSGGLLGLVGGVSLLRSATAANASAGWPSRREAKPWYLPAIAVSVSGLLTFVCFLDWPQPNVIAEPGDTAHVVALWGAGIATLALLLAVVGWRLGSMGWVGAGAAAYALAAFFTLVVTLVLWPGSRAEHIAEWLALLTTLAAALYLHWRVAAAMIGFIMADVVLYIVLLFFRGGWYVA